MPTTCPKTVNATENPLASAVALLQSRWPRHGLGTADLVPGQCLMRFAAAGTDWIAESGVKATVESGSGEPLDKLDSLLTSLRRRHPHSAAIGYIAYEAGYRWVGLPPAEKPEGVFRIPDMQFLVFDQIRSEPRSRVWDSYAEPKNAYGDHELQSLARSSKIHATIDGVQYAEAIDRIKTHIDIGDIYQANYTQAFDVQTGRGGLEIYEELAASNPAPFAAYLRFPPIRWRAANGAACEFPEIEIISNSPERFWKRSGASVETRPIKGTIARGRTGTLDRENRRRLMSSEKDRAELLMITDLERNDLGRVALTGSVKVQALRRARACPSIWHLESLVTAQVGTGVRWPEIMRALFPGGSITGAPKRRAMEILRGLEPVPRGVYCGAIGWIGANGDADFSIAIRTALKVGRHVRVHGGGGIVADSDPLAEYHESLIKIAPLLECLCR